VIIAIKILYASGPIAWTNGRAKGRKVYDTLVAAMSVDNVHYYISSISCSLPTADKNVAYTWGGSVFWDDDFHNALISILKEQKLAGYTDATPGQFRCFFELSCGGEAEEP
jgi:hypothetical protein